MPIIDEGNSLIPYSNTAENKCVSYGDLINAINCRVIISCLPTGLPDSNNTAQYTYEQSGALVITDNIPSGFSNNLEFYLLDEEIYSHVNTVGVRVFKDYGASSQQWLQQYSYTVHKPAEGSPFVFPTSQLANILSLIQSQYYDNNITVMFLAAINGGQYPIILLKYLGQRKYETKFDNYNVACSTQYYPNKFLNLSPHADTYYLFPFIRIDSTEQKNLINIFKMNSGLSIYPGSGSYGTTYDIFHDWSYYPSQTIENKTHYLSKIGVAVSINSQNNTSSVLNIPLYGSYTGSIRDKDNGTIVANFSAGEDLYPTGGGIFNLQSAPDSALASISGELTPGHTYEANITISGLTPVYTS